MNADIRLSVDFWSHPKTVKLKRRLGLEGPVSLQVLWAWAARNRPDGDLSGMDEEDIEIAAGWEGEGGLFVPALVELRWLDRGEAGTFLHDWQEHNPWAANAEDRSDRSRFVMLAKVAPQVYAEMKAQGITAISREDYDRIMAARRPDDNRTEAARQQDASTPLAGRKQDAEQDASTPLGPSPSPSPSPLPSPLPSPMDITPPTPPRGGPGGQVRKTTDPRQRQRGRDSPPPATWNEAVARFQERHGVGLAETAKGGQSHAGAGLPALPGPHA